MNQTRSLRDSAPFTFVPGDAEGYEELFSRYAPRVKGYMLKRGLSHEAAEELTQEVMLSIWRRGSSYNPSRASFSTWVFTIARNRCIDHLRRGARPEPDPDDPCWVESVSAPAGPEDDAVTRRRHARLRSALTALDDDQRRALCQVYFEGQTNTEAASVLGVPVGTVKSRTRRALEALRRHLGDGELDHD